MLDHGELRLFFIHMTCHLAARKRILRIAGSWRATTPRKEKLKNSWIMEN
jgi:hypothetical protein